LNAHKTSAPVAQEGLVCEFHEKESRARIGDADQISSIPVGSRKKVQFTALGYLIARGRNRYLSSFEFVTEWLHETKPIICWSCWGSTTKTPSRSKVDPDCRSRCYTIGTPSFMQLYLNTWRWMSTKMLSSIQRQIPLTSSWAIPYNTLRANFKSNFVNEIMTDK
jgi:hypothetical protein